MRNCTWFSYANWALHFQGRHPHLSKRRYRINWTVSYLVLACSLIIWLYDYTQLGPWPIPVGYLFQSMSLPHPNFWEIFQCCFYLSNSTQHTMWMVRHSSNLWKGAGMVLRLVSKKHRWCWGLPSCCKRELWWLSWLERIVMIKLAWEICLEARVRSKRQSKALLKKVWMNYIGLPLEWTFLKDVLSTQPWHLSTFGERVEDKGAPIGCRPMTSSWQIRCFYQLSSRGPGGTSQQNRCNSLTWKNPQGLRAELIADNAMNALWHLRISKYSKKREKVSRGLQSLFKSFYAGFISVSEKRDKTRHHTFDNKG